jgi:ribosomal protein L1
MPENKPRTDIDHAFAIFDEETQRVLKNVKAQLGKQEIPPSPKRQTRRRNVIFNPFGG